QINLEDSGKAALIDAMARQFFYERQYAQIKYDSAIEAVHRFYLNSPFEMLQTFSFFKLFNHLVNAGKKYKARVDIRQIEDMAANKKYRLSYVNAMALYEQHKGLLNKYLFLKKQVQATVNELIAPQFNVSQKSVVSPDKKIKLRLSFQNFHTLYWGYMRVDAATFIKSNTLLNTDELFEIHPLVRDSLRLPDPSDFQNHQIEFDINPLLPGYYFFFYSDKPITDASSDAVMQKLTVSNLAFVQATSRLYILDRTSGKPITGAKVWPFSILGSNPLGYKAIGETNKEGWAKRDKDLNENHQIVIVKGTDTLVAYTSKRNERNYDDETFNKEEDDDLLSYHEDHLSVQYFLDRKIYRPGQTVHYKGIIFTNDPKTGKKIIFNKKNLGFSLWQRMFNKDVREITHQKLALFIYDAFSREVDSAFIRPNDFGSFSGSFKIPMRAATGTWSIELDDIDSENYNDGEFEVENYKRPGFELQLQKPKDFLIMGDSFQVKAQVRSFAGADLQQVQLQYEISVGYTYTDSSSNTIVRTQDTIIANQTLSNPRNGIFEIPIPAHFLHQYWYNNNSHYYANYSITAKAIDGTGESQEASLNINLKKRPVNISINNFPSKLDAANIGNYKVTTVHPFSGPCDGNVEVKLYKTSLPSTIKLIDPQVDYCQKNGQWYLRDAIQVDEQMQPLLQLDTVLATNNKELNLQSKALTPGYYRIDLTVKQQHNIVGLKTIQFEVLDLRKNAASNVLVNYLPSNTLDVDRKIKWFNNVNEEEIHAIYELSYYRIINKKAEKRTVYISQIEYKGLAQLASTVEDNPIVGQIEMKRVYIFENVVYEQRQNMYVPSEEIKPANIIIEKYRNVLQPGDDATFEVRIQTQSPELVQELATTMYDASLDKIAAHKWELRNDQPRFYAFADWETEIYYNETVTYYPSSNLFDLRNQLEIRALIWWMDDMPNWKRQQFIKNPIDESDKFAQSLSGRVAGVSVTQSSLSEVVVTGYGITSRKSITGSVSTVTIRGISSLHAYQETLVVIDGKIYEGDVKNIDLSKIYEGLVLQGADATAIYGSRASSGVLLLSTNGPVKLPEPPPPPTPVIRKNFSETAFFYPNVYADENGIYHIQFTIPESVTEWKWKLLAHDKSGTLSYLEKTIYTQLPLMAQPSMPRFLYEGDRVQLRARVSNLDTILAKGIALIKAEDIISGTDITSFICKQHQINFEVAAKGNTAVAFPVQIPAGFLHPIKITVTAQSQQFADGETYELPILSRKVLVTQSTALQLAGNGKQMVTTPQLQSNEQFYGMGLMIQPQPQEMLLYGLSYLSNYKYRCAEQTINKMFAKSVALHLARKDSSVQNLMQLLQQTNGEENLKALPGELAQETMPWLQFATMQRNKQTVIKKLLDTTDAKQTFIAELQHLQSLQQADGGITWFSGGRSDNYISNYILKTIAQALTHSLPMWKENNSNEIIKGMLNKLMGYCETNFLKRGVYGYDLQFVHARGLLATYYPIDTAVQIKMDSVLAFNWKAAYNMPMQQQLMLIQASQAHPGEKAVFLQQANDLLGSIAELAIEDSVMGLHWKKLHDAADLEACTEETIALLLQAFNQNSNSSATVSGILKWLYTARKDHYWSNTRATAAVVDGILQSGKMLLEPTAALRLETEEQTVKVNNHLLNGNSFAFQAMDKKPSAVWVFNTTNQPTKGGVNFYYFTSRPPKELESSGVQLTKQLYRWD
ncbi:MAG: hypothetical protein RLY16_1048, partial [Bacteroidota bacterium]